MATPDEQLSVLLNSIDSQLSAANHDLADIRTLVARALALNTSPPVEPPIVLPAQVKYAVDPDGPAARWLADTKNASSSLRPVVQSAANVAQARWFGNLTDGAWLKGWVDPCEKDGTVAILTPYNMLNRDNGGASAGGAKTEVDYRKTTDIAAKAIGARHVIIVVEPDTVIHNLDAHMPSAVKLARRRCINYAVATYKKQCPNADVYLDMGDGYWNSASAVVNEGLNCGLALADGFSVNVANYETTETGAYFAGALNDELVARFTPPKRVLIDVSRNGNGPTTDHKNADPTGRKLGPAPTTGYINGQTAHLVWVKNPGVGDVSGQFDAAALKRLTDGK